MQYLLHSAPDRSGSIGCGEPRLATLLKLCRPVSSQGIAREKYHPLTQVGVLMAEQSIEVWPIEPWSGIRRSHKTTS